MGVLNNSWLLLVAIIYGAYIAAILLVVFGVVAFVRAVRRGGLAEDVPVRERAGTFES